MTTEYRINSGVSQTQPRLGRDRGALILRLYTLLAILLCSLYGEVASAQVQREQLPMEKTAFIPTYTSSCATRVDTLGEATSCVISQYTIFCNVVDSAATVLTYVNGIPAVYALGATGWETCDPSSGVRINPYHTVNAYSIAVVPSCQPGYQYQTNPGATAAVDGYCYINVVKIIRSLKPCPTCVGDPLYPGTGNNRQEERDYTGVGLIPLSFSRIYNSITPHGPTWMHTYTRFINYTAAIDTIPAVATLYRPEGAFSFTKSGSQWVSDSDVKYALSGDTGSFIVTTPDGTEREYYGDDDQLRTVRTAAGTIKYTLAYNSGFNPAVVSSVADPWGHSLQFAYNSLGQLTSMTDPNGSTYLYAYDGSDAMTSVTYPDNATRTYVYNESSHTAGVSQPRLLTGIIDENSARYATFGYSTLGNAVLSEHAGGAEHVALSYTIEPLTSESSYIDVPFYTKYIIVTTTPPSGATVSDGLGAARNFSFVQVNGGVLAAGSSAVCTVGCSQVAHAQSYDANGNLSSTTDFNGNITNFSYDLTRNVELSRTEAFGTARARTTSTTWNTTFRLPATVTEPNRTTTYTYDSMGNVLTKTLSDLTSGGAAPRTWTSTYNSYGQILTTDGPRTDVSDTTTNTYYSCTTGNECGQLHTVTNALGQVTTYNDYNSHGQPLTSTDRNGVVTTLTYDSRARLSSRQSGGETSSYQYWPTGLLKKVIEPDGSYIQYTYDNAHRLVQLSDGFGNHVDYTVDAMGNRTAEVASDSLNVLAAAINRVYNSLSELTQQIGAAGTAAVTTTFGYDENGNQTSVHAPLTRNTTEQYDELNRLKQVTDPAGGVVVLAYDANDNLTSVADPTTVTTSYQFNGLGDLKLLNSPATGSRVNTFDSGGNLHSSTDSRNATATYSYDVLNRVTQITYGDQTVSFGYDFGTNGKGRLTSAGDADHSMGWQYDALGRLSGKSQSVGGVTLVNTYTYANGRLTALATPSGQTIVYIYSNGKVTGISVNGTTLLSGVTYESFGPVRGWTWGNGTAETRLHDADGNPSLISGIESKAYTVDSAFRVVGIANSSNASLSWTHGYDALDRLSNSTSSIASLVWTYDSAGNRQTQSGGAGPGYPTSNVSFIYNNRNRMISAVASGTTSYFYNALGQRIEKAGPNGTVLFMYDEAGHIEGEYTGAGALIQETVWLNDLPVATLRPHSGGGVDVYYIHVDHLDSPRIISRPSDNAIVWRWDSNSFGASSPNQNPSGLGTFIYNLRFPGQYSDAESNLNYNYLRDYDAQVGRYAESDPAGLRGGINTYAYVEDDPIDAIDPFGRSKIHGNWCGADWTGGYQKSWDQLTLSEQKTAKAPVDPLDKECMKHDKCYADCRGSFPCNQGKRSDCFLVCDRALENSAFQIGGWWGNVIGSAMARPGPRNEENSKSCPSCNAKTK